MTKLTVIGKFSGLVFLPLAFLALMVYFLFHDVFAFNFETYLNHQYLLIFWLPILALQLIGLYKKTDFNNYSALVGLLLINTVLSLLCFSSYYSFSNEYFFTIIGVGLTCFALFLNVQITVFEIIVTAFVLLFFFQLYLGIDHRLNLSSDDGLLLTGSLQNSGVYAYYLVFNLPLCYWLCFHKRFYITFQIPKLLYKVLFTAILLIVVYLIYYTKSRTAFICLAFITGYYLLAIYKTKLVALKRSLSKSILLVIVSISVSIIIALGMWLFNFKRLSAVGRLLNINVFFEQIGDYFWFGTGLGRFTWYYPQWQANYFRTEANPKFEYFLSADESYILFNEHLQLLGTIGIFGFLLCGYFLYRFFKLQAKEQSNLLMATKCTVAVILFGCLTSYPFHVNIILLLFGSCLAIAFGLAQKAVFLPAPKIRRYLSKVIISICLLLICVAFYKGYRAYTAAKQWQVARKLHITERLANYDKIYPVLNNDGKFLTEYGEALLTDSVRKLVAIAILEESKRLSITRKNIEALVTAYSNAKQYHLAILNQQFLVNYMPNKFTPRYDLLELYVLQNDTANIRKTAQTMLKMLVKKPSFEVQRIKLDTRNILKKYE